MLYLIVLSVGIIKPDKVALIIKELISLPTALQARMSWVWVLMGH